MQLLDGNGNKKVSADEMKAFWKGFFDLSWSEEDILLAFDQDSDGELDMEEFHRYEKEGDLLYYYTKADMDNDGFLSMGEMLEDYGLVGGTSKDAYMKMLTKDSVWVDVNNDKKWDFKEYKEWMKVKSKDDKFIQEEVFNAFKFVDKNRDGFISGEEMNHFHTLIGASERATWGDMLVMMLDIDKDGLLGYPEYAVWVKMDEDTFDELLAYDMDANMKVSPEEIKAAWMGWYNIVWSEDDILLAFDANNDGELNMEEFYYYKKEGNTLYYYKKMDQDSNDLLTRGEMLDGLNKWGISKEFTGAIMAKDFAGADVNEDDNWSFSEFKEWMAIKIMENDFIREDFNALDMDGNGFVSAEEYVKWSLEFGANERASWGSIFIMMFDQDQDSLLNFQEYAAGMYDFAEGRNSRSERDAVDQKTMRAMQVLDRNRNKKVSADEMKVYWKGFAGVAWSEEHILLAFDQDGDGELNMEEFHRYDEEGEDFYYYTKMDIDNDGVLTRGDMLDALKKWGMSVEFSEAIVTKDFAEVDVNEDESWSFAEFKDWMAIKTKEEDFIREDFNAHDMDGDGFVSAEDFDNWSLEIGANERASWGNLVIRMCDQNQDSLFNFQEFALCIHGFETSGH